MTLLFAFACSDSFQIAEKEQLDYGGLETVVVKRNDFKSFISIHIQNVLAVKELNEGQLSKLQNSSESFISKFSGTKTIDKAEIVDLLKAANVSSKAVEYLVELTQFLNKNYKYSGSDLESLMNTYCEKEFEVKSKSSRTQGFYGNCYGFCTIGAAAYTIHWLNEGATQQFAGSMGAAYYVGCSAGCGYQQK